MKSINISKKTFDTLEHLQLPDDVLSTESNLYVYNFRGQDKLVKKLHMTNGEYFATKLYTVAMLDEFKDNLPSCFVVPDYTLSINHETVGFTVPRIHGVTLSTLLKSKDIDPSEQIDYLKKVGEIIRQLMSIRKYTALDSLYLNDINESNFMVNPNNRELFAIDLDSVKILSNKIFPARYLSKNGLLSNVPDKYIRNESAWDVNSKYEYKNRFYEGYYIPSTNTELYCYSILILNYLYGDSVNVFSLDEFYRYLTYLEYIGINKELIDCLANIVNTPDNYNPGDYLESLTSQNVYRARENVYKLNKNRI